MRARTIGLLAICSAMTPVGSALARSGSSTGAAATELPADSTATTDQSGEIIVTGSRLNSGFTAPTPTTVLGVQSIQERAPAQISEVVNRLPAVRTTVGPSQSQRLFGGGQAPIDLRGLGTARTLTLVDGNRFTPANENGTVDSSLIPVNLIDRIDVVTGGASAAYGSDAVAGVINFVLRKKLTGIELSLQQGISEEGDGRETVASFAAGTGFAEDRGHFIIGIDFAENKGVGTIYTRDWGRRLPGLISNGAAPRAAGVPAQSFETGVTWSRQTAGGLIQSGPLQGTAFGPGGVPFQFQYGQVFSNLMVGGSNPGLNPFGNWPLITPTSRLVALGRAEYDLGGVTAFVEGNYGRNLGLGFTTFNQATFTIRRDNPFLPAETRSQMEQLGLQTIPVGRVLTENGGARQRTETETFRGIGGLQGNLLGDFKWDASVQYGRTRLDLTVQDVLPANYAAAVGGCVAPLPADAQAGCVPINIFGRGSPSQASLDYIQETARQITHNSRFVAAANLRGSPFSTWAGPVETAFGAEYRRDTLDAVSDPLGQAGLFYAANYTTYAGSVNVKEAYAEIGLPLAKDAAFARSIDVNGAIRYTDYSTSGGVVTWKVGGTWALGGFRLRATRSRDIRAPNLGELFASFGSGVGVASYVNPFNLQSGALITSETGNPLLKPERADTTTIGVVFEPEWARGLHISVDYFNIKIKDVIASVGATEVVQRCFNGQTIYCPAITFDNTPFGIANVNAQPFNLNRLRNNGIDIEFAYRLDLPGDSGRLDFRALATRTFHLTTIDATSSVDRAGSFQGGGVPRWVGSGDLTYSRGGFLTTLSARYIAATQFDANRIGPDDSRYAALAATASNTINYNRFPSAVYLDLYAEAKVATGRTNMTVFGSVQNLAGKDPPQFAAIGISSGGNPYDLIGRRFRVGVRLRR